MSEFLSHSKVTIGGFWAEKQRLVREVTLPYQWEALNDRVKGADRSGAVRNFKIAAGKAKGAFYGFFFQDSDLAKWIEAAAYSLAMERNPKLERSVDRMIDLIVASQAEDGYLNTYYTIKESPDLRWTDLRDMHEMYVSGHLLEASVAYFQATGKRVLLDAMVRNVGLVESLFGRGKGQRRGYPGHPELELALSRLHDVTGDPGHLRLAKYFIDERGAPPRFFDRESKRLRKTDYRSDEWYAIYNQSHVPIREQKEIVGHAVRACYLFAAAADVARKSNDRRLFATVKGLWRNATERRMYLTGGVGSTFLGEAFTFDYDLPNEWAYAETCAAIALVLWSRRMLETEIDSRYADVIEKVLYNGFLSALSLDGTHCFYRNPLTSVPDSKYPNRHVRRSWHECACCPPNLSRLMMSLGGYIYSTHNRSLFVHLFIDSEVSFEIAGHSIRLLQKTRYPWAGKVEFEFDISTPCRFKLAMRIPAWTKGASLQVNGEAVDLAAATSRGGYASLDRSWKTGDRITLNFPMQAERIWSHPNVRQNAGKVALQRGPVVYCLEEADNGPGLHEITLPRSARLRVSEKQTELGKIPILSADARRRTVEEPGGALYRDVAEAREHKVKLVAVPYHLWANRGMGEMTVWMNDDVGSGE